MNNKIKEVMAKVFNTSVGDIPDDASQDNMENWDSIHHIQMIVLLEREFNITIPDEYVGSMISFKLITEVINKCHGIHI
jgi:acyl carrier protein